MNANRSWRGLLVALLCGAGLMGGCNRETVEVPPAAEPERSPSVSAAPAREARDVREPAVAGSFYSGTAERLTKEVAHYLGAAKRVTSQGVLLGGVVPHAGYRFSGRCAASLYRLLGKGACARVVILAPSHRVRFMGISLPAQETGAYRTPLGKVPIDIAACDALAGEPGFSRVQGADRREHSLEVQLPFLQQTLGTFALVPLICGHVPDSAVAGVGAALARLLDGNTLILASSDFTHYGRSYGFVPFQDDVRRNLYDWLEMATGLIAALDGPGFSRHCREKRDTICGQIPVKLLISALTVGQREVRGQVLDMYTSGDVSGDFNNSVSYAAIGFFAAGDLTSGDAHDSGTP